MRTPTGSVVAAAAAGVVVVLACSVDRIEAWQSSQPAGTRTFRHSRPPLGLTPTPRDGTRTVVGCRGQQRSRPYPSASHPSSSMLRYRVLDEDDDSSVMQKVQTRAPPGFDMKEAVSGRVAGPDEGNGRGPARPNALNRPLIRALQINQALILAAGSIVCLILLLVSGAGLADIPDTLRWTGEGPGVWDLVVTPSRFAMGLAGAIPLLAISSLVENSDSRAFANVNFSTIVMSMTLFGRRRAPSDEFIPPEYKGKKVPTTSTLAAFYQSFAMSLITGICEETIFRREVPALICRFSGGNVVQAFFGQACFFALGHANQGVALEENAIVMGLQLLNGLGFGLLYIASHGDIVPCIVAHTLYDLVTFFKTWIDANGQLEYAEDMSIAPLSAQDQQQVSSILRSNPRINPNLFNKVKRLFFTFDFDKNKTLSLSEVRKGIAYMALERAGQPPPQREVDRLFAYTVQTREEKGGAPPPQDNRLSFPDFFRLYSTMMGQGSQPRVR